MRLLHLSLLLFLGLVATCASLAAPAPVARTWETGWQVVDPAKNASFNRKGDVLTIEMSAKKDKRDYWDSLERTPCLLRDIEGDFVAEIRLGGNILPPDLSLTASRHPVVAAGLILLGEKHTQVRVQRITQRLPKSIISSLTITAFNANGITLKADGYDLGDWPTDQILFLRMRRKGDSVLAAFSKDRKKWQDFEPVVSALPARLRLGVCAASNSKSPFKPRFDRFRLTLSGPKGR